MSEIYLLAGQTLLCKYLVYTREAVWLGREITSVIIKIVPINFFCKLFLAEKVAPGLAKHYCVSTPYIIREVVSVGSRGRKKITTITYNNQTSISVRIAVPLSLVYLSTIASVRRTLYARLTWSGRGTPTVSF